mgnify:FL=1
MSLYPGKRVDNVPLKAPIFNFDTDNSPVEPTPQSPYNARALNEDETRVGNG